MKISISAILMLSVALSACSKSGDDFKAADVGPSIDSDKVIRKNEWCVVADQKDVASYNIPSDRRVIGRLQFGGYETSAGGVTGTWYAIRGSQAITFPMELKNSDRWVHTGPTPEVLTRSYGMILSLDAISGGSPKDIALYSLLDGRALENQPGYRLHIKSSTFKSGVATAYPCSIAKIKFTESYSQSSDERNAFDFYRRMRSSYENLPEMTWPFRSVQLNRYYLGDKTWCSIVSEDSNASELSIMRFNSDGSTTSVWKIRTRNSIEQLRYVYAMPNANVERNQSNADYQSYQETGGALFARTFNSTANNTRLTGYTDGRGMGVLILDSGRPLVECRAFRDQGGVYRIGRYVTLSGSVERDGLTIEPGAELIYRALGF